LQSKDIELIYNCEKDEERNCSNVNGGECTLIEPTRGNLNNTKASSRDHRKEGFVETTRNHSSTIKIDTEIIHIAFI